MTILGPDKQNSAEQNKVPIGHWAKDRKMKEIGRLMRVQMIQSIPSFMIAYYTRILGYTMERTQVTMEAVKREFQDRSLHLYLRWYFVCGQKPLDSGQ
jgi:hypothetical protein